MIDVGQGDACLIQTPYHKNMLIDGGGSAEENGYDIGKNVLIPYLLSKQIKTIHYIIVSHFDTDHVGGLLTVMEELDVKNVIISKQVKNSQNYEKFKKIVKQKKINVIIVEATSSCPNKIQIENDLYFDVLWPNNDAQINDNPLNNNSIVCKLNYNDFSILFTGDIEKIAEQQILKKYENSNILNSTVLKVAHHGSKTSSTNGFLEAVKPKIALVGVGKDNLFGHPNKEVIESLENLSVRIYRTDEMGEIKIKVNKKGEIKEIHEKIPV